MSNNKNNLLPEFKIIECRQQANGSSSFVDRGCDFETIIPDGVELKNGEGLSVASCFLDTVANDSGLIELENNDPANPDNCIISASFFYYLADIPTTNEARYRGDHDEAPPQGGNAGELLPPIIQSKTYIPARNLDDFDGQLYIACSKSTLQVGTPAVKIDGFNLIFSGDFIRNTEKSQYWFIIDLTFTDFDGVTQHQQVFQLNRPAKGKDTASNDIVMSFLKEGNILEVNNNFIQEYGKQCIQKGINNQFVQRRVFGINSLDRPNDPANRADDISVFDSLASIGFSGITNIDSCLQTSPFNGSNDHLRPIVGTISISLPATTYGADELAQLIGREFSKANQENRNMNIAKDNICANPLLKSSRQMRQELHDAGKPIDEVHFVRANDANQTFQLNTVRNLNGGESASQLANYYIGSSQFGLIYDDTTNKMSIDLMHTSFLDVSQRDGGGLPETRIYKNAVGEEFIATTYSGIVLNDLQPTSLWKDAFKFDLEKLLVGYREVEKVYQATPDVNTIAPVFDLNSGQDNRLVAGQNITTELGSIDGCVIKRSGASGGNPTANPATAQTSANTQCFDLVPPAPSNQFFIDYFASIQQDHLGIFGKGQVSNNNYPTEGGEGLGYYQIEVDINGVSTDTKGKDKYNNKIMSVISKYYSSTNYLSSYDEGSTQFFYKGELPLKITKVHVRVLDPDGSLANINNDNTIFLKLQKQK